MHHKDLKIIENFNVTGRGVILVTEFDGLMEGEKVNVGDTVRYGQKLWEITAMEGFASRGDLSRYGLVVKEITQKDLFCKIVSKEKSPWLQDAKWRRKNRWWINIFQKIQLFLLSHDIKKPRWIFELTKTPKK